MNLSTIRKAKREAEEFVRRAKIVLDETEPKEPANSSWMWGTANTAALRRQSMELTRALAEMRRA
jgi:hypothetical protein